MTVELNNWKKRYLEQDKMLKRLIKASLLACDRNMLIEILKKRGIIKRDWLQKNEVYEMSINQELQEK